jgi:hypothetical protein
MAIFVNVNEDFRQWPKGGKSLAITRSLIVDSLLISDCG